MNNRKELIVRLAKAYYNVLNVLGLTLNEPDIEYGLKEGLNKFLSNVSIRIQGKYNIYSTDYVSEKALLQLQKKDKSNLIYEHMIPKNLYIQRPCIEAAKAGKCYTLFEIENLLNKYWYIALITKEENNILNSLKLRTKMPKNWDGKNIFARYECAKISLISTNNINI